MTVSRRLALASACAIVLAASPALAQRRDPGASGPPSGTVTLSAKGAAVGVGYTWGDGILHFGGRNYPFSINGLSIADVGFSRVSGRGRVYNLHRLQDFSGTYAGLTGEATAGNGTAGRVLQNANGVQIRIDEVTRGARLQGSADGIKLTLK